MQETAVLTSNTTPQTSPQQLSFTPPDYALTQHEVFQRASDLCKKYPMLPHRKAMGIISSLHKTNMLTEENLLMAAHIAIATDYVRNTFKNQSVTFIAMLIGRYGTWPLKIAREKLRDPAEAKGFWLGMFVAAAHKIGYEWCKLARHIYAEIQYLMPKEAEREKLAQEFIEGIKKYGEFRREFNRRREELGLIPKRPPKETPSDTSIEKEASETEELSQESTQSSE